MDAYFQDGTAVALRLVTSRLQTVRRAGILQNDPTLLDAMMSAIQ
jgi:hypothetical protein